MYIKHMSNVYMLIYVLEILDTNVRSLDTDIRELKKRVPISIYKIK